MSTENHKPAIHNSSRLDGHRLSEFIYGTVTGLVAIAGLGGSQGVGWFDAATIILFGAMAIWIAHAYSTLISKRVITGHRLGGRDLAEALAGSWPVVSAGLILALPLLPVGLGLWPLDTGLWLSSLTGIALLAVMGFLAGVVAQETWSRRLLLAALSAGLGVAIVILELLVHH